MRLKTFALTAIGAAALAAGALHGCGSSDDSVPISSGTVLRNVTVVSTTDGTLQPAMAVAIEGGKIAHIVANEKVVLQGSAVAVDASGKYVVPGFLDMHVHTVDSPITPAVVAGQPSSGDFQLLVANGVTGVRQMSGSADTIAAAHKLNADVAAGVLDAPEVLMVPGTIFGGQASTDADARAFVDAQKAAGADFMKVVGGNAVAMLAVMDESRKVGLKVSGHLPNSVSAWDLSNLGWHAIEHLGGSFGMLLDCSSDEAAIRQDVLAAPPIALPTGPTSPGLYYANPYETFYERMLASQDATKCAALADTFVRNDTWHAPTLIRVRTVSFNTDPTYLNDPNLVYLTPTVRAFWTMLEQQYAANVLPGASAAMQQAYPVQQQTVSMMIGRGVKMMTGSDAGGIWVIPGFSLHQEFHELAAAGLTPLQILQAATLNGAQFAGRQATMGSVAEGKEADLVLLDANPIASAANLDLIAAVVLNGKYLSRDKLAAMKSAVATAAAATPLQPVASVIDLNHGNHID
jgi:imidazolonepropionase-like amidohydrolase